MEPDDDEEEYEHVVPNYLRRVALAMAFIGDGYRKEAELAYDDSARCPSKRLPFSAGGTVTESVFMCWNSFSQADIALACKVFNSMSLPAYKFADDPGERNAHHIWGPRAGNDCMGIAGRHAWEFYENAHAAVPVRGTSTSGAGGGSLSAF